MKRSLIVSLVVLALWLGILVHGVEGYSDIMRQNVIGFPSDAQVRYYVLIPAIMTVASVVIVLLSFTSAVQILRRITTFLLLFFLPVYLFYSMGGI